MEKTKSDSPPADLAAKVAELSHEVTETRNQMIKTANIIGNLSSEIREVGHLHRQQRRGLSINSISAYVLFLVVVSTSFYFTYRARVERLDFEKDAVVREHAASLNKLEKMRQTTEKRREAEVKAAAFYRLSKSGNVKKALGQYPDVVQLPLSRVEAALFHDWASRTRSRLAYSAYSRAMKAVAEQQWKRAATEFQTSVHYLPAPPHEASLRYYLGVALMKLGNYQEAAQELEKASAADAEKLVSNEIRYHLGSIYEHLGRREKARAAYGAFVKKFSSSPRARAARRRLEALK